MKWTTVDGNDVAAKHPVLDMMFRLHYEILA